MFYICHWKSFQDGWHLNAKNFSGLFISHESVMFVLNCIKIVLPGIQSIYVNLLCLNLKIIVLHQIIQTIPPNWCEQPLVVKGQIGWIRESLALNNSDILNFLEEKKKKCWKKFFIYSFLKEIERWSYKSW